MIKKWRHPMAVIVAAIAMAWAFFLPEGRCDTPETPQPLRESLKLTDEAKRESLVTGAYQQLRIIEKKHPGNLLVHANCQTARDRIEREYGKDDVPPMMLVAWTGQLPDGELFLMYNALDSIRECDRLILMGKKPDGALLRVVYRFPLECKTYALVGAFGYRVRAVGIRELEELGEVTRDLSGTEAQIVLEIGTGSMPVPDLPLLVAAVGNRKGQVSNFVEVMRKVEKSAEKEQAR